MVSWAMVRTNSELLFGMHIMIYYPFFWNARKLSISCNVVNRKILFCTCQSSSLPKIIRWRHLLAHLEDKASAMVLCFSGPAFGLIMQGCKFESCTCHNEKSLERKVTGNLPLKSTSPGFTLLSNLVRVSYVTQVFSFWRKRFTVI